ncbi:adenine phosphoribosyltransferase [Aurantibacillus circumpalustris]|uniref:adenine phosphoribosyltransferase n=1 Tax=Aurantibacillus circumpalustris TaxID=3036359 RepID=UPI00295AF03A|nr:adenine phosphoribosyltransferase [Aurantibacillus circumpalustris]
MTLEQSIKKEIRDIADFPKPGIIFKDITPLFYKQELCNDIVNGFIERLEEVPDAIIGIESRGFLFGFLVANKLNVPFVLVRKAGKLPYKTVKEEYALEYGTSIIEMHEDALEKGWNVIIHDDLIATGGTAQAAAKLVEKMGAKVAGFNFVVSLDFLNGKSKLVNHTNNITCLVHY